MSNLLFTTNLQTSQNAPVAFEDVTGLTSGTVSVTSGSIIILQASVPITLSGDDGCEFSFSVGGTEEGPEVILSYSDGVDEGYCGNLIYVLTGLSGDQTFSVEWKRTTGISSLDTGRDRTFQVIELLAAEVTVLVNVVSVTAQNAPTNYADITDFTTGAKTPAASGNIILFISTPSQLDEGDMVADFKFADGGTTEGPEMGLFWMDGVNLGAGGGLVWAKEAGDTDEHTYSFQWKLRTSTPRTDTGRNRTFTVLELLNTSIGINVAAVTAQTPGTSFADVLSMTGSITPDSSNSIIWMFASVMIDLALASDRTWNMQFKDSSLIGPELTAFSDNIGEGGSTGMAWAETGITGSHTISVQYKRLTPVNLARLDTARNRTFQVIDLKAPATPGPVYQHPIRKFQHNLVR